MLDIYQRRYTRYIVEHGASVDAFVLATHYRLSPLIQGGLKIPIKLVVKLTGNEVNSAEQQKYPKFVDENYREPVDEKLADDTERILKLIGHKMLGLERTTMMKTYNMKVINNRNRTEYLVH